MGFDINNLKRIFNKANKEPAAVAAIMAVFLVCVGFTIAEQVQSLPIEKNEENTEEEKPDSTANLKFRRPRSLLKDISKDDDDKVFEPAADKLNMAYYYAEDADTDDAINSYAGRVFQELNTKNASYLASFYDLTDVTPLSMAQKLGVDKTRVMGKYDPTNAAHDPANPDTWTVNSFKNVSVSFYDGDGNRINGYYVAQEIMSLASVYMYYHNNYNADDFLSYCEALFDSVVTSKMSLGNVYYCNGCLNKTTQQESAEALAMEAHTLAKENKLQIQTALSSGLGLGTVEVINESLTAEASDAKASSIEEIIDTGNVLSTEVNYYTESASDISASGSDASESTSIAAQGSIAETDTTEKGAGETLTETTASESLPIQTAETIEEIYDPNSASGAQVLGESYYADYKISEAEIINSAETTDSQTAAVIYESIVKDANESEDADETQAETAGYAVINSGNVETPKAFVGDDGNIYYTNTLEDPANLSSGYSTESESDNNLSDPSNSDAAGDELTKRINTLLQQANIQSGADSYCPGHIDIYVTIKIRGIDDKNGLFNADIIGNDSENFTDSWKGWTEERMAEARALNAQDWLEEYGLSISSININSPLTADEIQNYLGLLTNDISDLRRSIIEFALSSVGKIPYYWGGKPSGTGYSSNHFNTLISPDSRGRILKGLDCSGWINWVYWSVTGHSLAGQSTGTLVGCGRKISRADLKPGDIIIRVGDDAHVVMFLCWAEDGDFYAIHETGGVINNVTVSKMTANWPYYRSLAD